MGVLPPPAMTELELTATDAPYQVKLVGRHATRCLCMPATTKSQNAHGKASHSFVGEIRSAGSAFAKTLISRRWLSHARDLMRNEKLTNEIFFTVRSKKLH